MYSIFYSFGNEYILNDSNRSLANALLIAEDLGISYLEYCQGHSDLKDIFLNERPKSTINTKEYYALSKNNKIIIYRHIKNKHLLTSSHIHKKLLTIKILRQERSIPNIKRKKIPRLPDEVYNELIDLFNSNKEEMNE